MVFNEENVEFRLLSELTGNEMDLTPTLDLLQICQRHHLVNLCYNA